MTLTVELGSMTDAELSDILIGHFAMVEDFPVTSEWLSFGPDVTVRVVNTDRRHRVMLAAVPCSGGGWRALIVSKRRARNGARYTVHRRVNQNSEVVHPTCDAAQRRLEFSSIIDCLDRESRWSPPPPRGDIVPPT